LFFTKARRAYAFVEDLNMPSADDFQLNLFRKEVLHLFWKGRAILPNHAC